MTRYRLVRPAGSVGAFHHRDVADPARPEIWWASVDAAALVLGSNQPDDTVDVDACGRAGVEVVRRRSGGGAVLLIPAEVTWFDVIVPRGGPGWASDIHAPMRWLGEHLAAVLADRVAGTVAVHAGPFVPTRWSPVVCFDGRGVGEVFVDGAKLVGISQRRMRHAARLQCCWYSAYDSERLRSLLAPAQRPPAGALAPVAVAADVDPGQVLGELAVALGAARSR